MDTSIKLKKQGVNFSGQGAQVSTDVCWHQKGQSLTEIAIALPVLMVLFLGIVEVAYYMYADIAVRNITRESARVAIKETSDHTTAEWAALVMTTTLRSSAGSFLQPNSADDTIIVTKVKVALDGSLTCAGPLAATWPDGGQGPDSANSQFSDCGKIQGSLAQMPGILGHASGLQDDAFIITEYFHHHHPIIGLTVVAADGITLYSSATMRLIGQ